MMDEYLNHLISFSSLVDGDVKEKSSWICSEPNQPNVFLPSSLELHQDDKKNSPVSMISSNQSAESLATQDISSVVLGSESDYAVDKGLISEEARSQNGGQNGNPSPDGMVSDNLKFGNMGLQCDTILSTLSSLNHSKQLPVVADLTSYLSFTEATNAGNGRELSEYLRSLKNLQNSSSIPHLWPSLSYEGISSLGPLIGQDRMEGLGLQGWNLGDDMDIMGNRYVGMDKILQLDKLSTSPTTEGREDLQSCPFSSVIAEPNVQVAVNQLNQLSSVAQTTSTAVAGGCNGTGKPRVRARRGQATDPHSIAERLRREKIAERMKNLQELVPNSNKVDKASMLDEIIEYVKFLQLQVKVLSMSRLGAAGAVIPLLTDGQPEGHNSLSLSPSAGLGIDISPSPDQIAFEQEVLKLMESNVTMAMQYLQSKGLCLMPIALASAISSGKSSLSGTTCEERKKFGYTSGLFNSSSSSSLPGIDTHPLSFDNNIANGTVSSQGIIVNGCNEVVKQEELKNA